MTKMYWMHNPFEMQTKRNSITRMPDEDVAEDAGGGGSGGDEAANKVEDKAVDDTKAAADKVAEDKTVAADDTEKADAPEPLTMDVFTIPEGAKIDEKLSGEFLDVLNNAETSVQEKGQALLDLQLKAQTQAAEQSSQLWTNTQKEWQDAVVADADFGGEKLEGNLAAIAKLVDTYGSDELRGVMDQTGAGNHVEMVRFLSKIATALTEGGPVQGSPSADETSRAQRLFPNQGNAAAAQT